MKSVINTMLVASSLWLCFTSALQSAESALDAIRDSHETKLEVAKTFGPFGEVCDHRFYSNGKMHFIDDVNTFQMDLKNVFQKGDLVFVDSGSLDTFLNVVHPLIEDPYLLVTQKVFDGTSKKALKTLFYDNKIATIFSGDMPLSHKSKFYSIPILQKNLNGESYFQTKEDKSFGNIKELFIDDKNQELLLKDISNKADSCLANFFEFEPFCMFYPEPNGLEEKIIEKKTNNFASLVKSARFLAAPIEKKFSSEFALAGLEKGTIPVISHGNADRMLSDLPVLFVNDYRDIDRYYLLQQHMRLTDQVFTLDKLSFSYWENLLKSQQENIRESMEQRELKDSLFTQKELSNLKTAIAKFGPCRHGSNVYYKGKYTLHRPKQYLSLFTTVKNAFVCDPFYIDGAINEYMDQKDVPVIASKKNVIHIGQEIFDKYASARTYPGTLFFDLKYDASNFSKDLAKYYLGLPNGSMICGTNYKEQSVKEILQEFITEREMKIYTKNDMWFIRKVNK